MKIEDLLNNYDMIPYTIKLKNIKDYDRFEERFYDIDSIFVNILGMDVDFVEFFPNNEPPNRDEILAWLWVIHPEWKDKILMYANGDLKKVIQEYEEYTP